MSLEKRRWIGFRKRFRQPRENQCEVCGSLHNFRAGRPASNVRMDMAHLVARSELARFGSIGYAFNFDEENFALLCQICHAAFDVWLGVMGPRRLRRKNDHFLTYEAEFKPLLRRRDRLIAALISLTSQEQPNG